MNFIYSFLFWSISFILFPALVSAQDSKNCELIIAGQCTDCNRPEAFEINDEKICKALCPNRKATQIHRYLFCVLEECPKEYPIWDDYSGDCISETDSSGTSVFDEEFNEIKEAEKQYRIKTIDGKCPKDMPLLSYSKDYCYSCNYPFDIGIAKENSNICPNRVSIPYPWVHDDSTESYIICPKDKPLYSWQGKCMSCDHPTTIPVLSQCLEDDTICDVCPNRRILDQQGGNRPSVIMCPPDRPLMDVNGICFSCDIDIPISLVKKSDCEEFCPAKRMQKFSICVLNK